MRYRVWIVLSLTLGLLAWLIVSRLQSDSNSGHPTGQRGPAAVQVEAIERGPIELQRTFSATLEAQTEFTVVAHVGGRVERLLADLADPVTQGQVVAELDDRDHVQNAAEAAAELEVARANEADAEASLQIASREFKRLESLTSSGIVSESELDVARAQYLARQTGQKVARAHVVRTRATLQRARLRTGYAKVIAVWQDDAHERVVARRHVNQGDTVNPGDPLLTVVSIEPLIAVFHITEREYGLLSPGQPAIVHTDAYPSQEFSGTIKRIAPVFQEATRQARVELQLPNQDHRLKPGMFVRALVVLAREQDAVIVPVAALTTRQDVTGIFVVDAAGERVRWQPVRAGIRQGDHLQVVVDGATITGRVVTLGQQLIDDGSAIRIPNASSPEPTEDSSAP